MDLTKLPVSGENETQTQIFKTIFNRPASVKTLATTLGVKEKTIENNIPKLKRLVDEREDIIFVKNLSRDRIPLFSICPKKDLIVKVKPRMYTCVRSDNHPYIMITLPEPPNGYDHWVIYTLSDIHYGSNTCNVKVLTRFVEEVEKTPNALAVLKGDLIENGLKDSPGSSIYEQVIPPQEQKEKLIKILAPIAHKILYSVRGNHGYRSVKGVFLDPELDISTALNVEYFKGYVCVDILCESNDKLLKWEIFSYHGSGSSKTPEGRIKLIKDKAQWHSANIYTIGHVHDLQSYYDYEVIRDPETLSLKMKKRYYVVCGTTLEYFGSYAEEAALQPNKVGFAKIRLFCKGDNIEGYDVIT